MRDFIATMNAYRDEINQTLECLLAMPTPSHAGLVQAMRYATLDAGKRIRSILVLEFCRVTGGSTNDAMPFACAIEMLHCYSLVHDDLPCMDDDDYRRGKLTVHKKYDEATAVLVGDALLTEAFSLMATAPFATAHPTRALKAIQTLAKATGRDGMVLGQLLDLKNSEDGVTKQDLLSIHRYKTAYLLKAACDIGVLCSATASDDAVQTAGRFGLSLGMAFQLIDDLLDVVGDESTIGKPLLSDQASGKSTVVDLLGIEKSRLLAKKYTEQALQSLEALGDLAQRSELAFLQAMTKWLLNREQ